MLRLFEKRVPSLLLILLINCLCISAQQNVSAEQAQDIQQKMQSDSLQMQNIPTNSVVDENLVLPPVDAFYARIYEHPSIKIFETYRDEEQAILDETKREWLDYFRLIGNYQYGKSTVLSSSLLPEELVVGFSDRASHTYGVGASIAIPFGDLLSQGKKNKKQKAILRRVEYQYDMAIEERKLMILQAYNDVVQQLATLRAKSDAAALYNAQMKISEQDFVLGKISITTLSVERGRRTTAVVTYEEGKIKLHNAIKLLEILSNVSVMNK